MDANTCTWARDLAAPLAFVTSHLVEYPLSNYRPQTKFVKVMFSQVSVCPGGCLPLVLGGHLPHMHRPVIHPPGRHLPPGQTLPGQTLPPWVNTPWADTRQADTPLPSACWDTPPCPVHAEIWSTSGRYTSHWNAFLFF